MRKLFKNYFDILSLVPSKKKYFKILSLFICISILDILSISTLSILISKILNVPFAENLFTIIDNTSDEIILYFLIFIIIFKQIFYVIIYYIFLNYSYSLKNLFITRYIHTNFYQRYAIDKKEDQLNFIRIIEEFTYSSLIPSFMLIFEVIVILTTTLYVFFLDPLSTSIIIILFFSVSFIYFRKVPQIVNKLGEKNIRLNEYILKIIGYVHEGLREIISFDKIQNFKKPLNDNLESLKKQLVSYDIINALPRISFEILLILSLSIVFFINKGSTSSFLFNSSIFIFAFTKLIPSLIKFMNIFNSINYGKYSLDKIIIINDRYNKAKTNNEFKYSNTAEDFDEIHVKDLEIEFIDEITKENKKIKYPNFEIKKNQKILLSSRSGVGKSTFLDILSGFKKPSQGNIQIKYQGKYFNISPNIISYSPQFNLITDNNYKSNLNLFIDDNDHIEQDIEKIEKNFFEQNKQIFLLNSILNISGGEKKRVGILRAIKNINKRKKILIFDEPTASLDIENKNKFYEWLSDLNNKTIIISSHDTDKEHFFDKVIYF